MQFWPRKPLTLCPDQKCPFLLLKRKHPCCPCSVLKPFLFLGEIPWFTNGFTRKTSPPARASGGTCRWCSAWNSRWKSLQDSSFKPRFWREKISSMLENNILQSWRKTPKFQCFFLWNIDAIQQPRRSHDAMQGIPPDCIHPWTELEIRSIHSSMFGCCPCLTMKYIYPTYQENTWVYVESVMWCTHIPKKELKVHHHVNVTGHHLCKSFPRPEGPVYIHLYYTYVVSWSQAGTKGLNGVYSNFRQT